MGYPTPEQKVDYLFKKIGFSASKTGVAEDQTGFAGNQKAPPNEAIPSPLVIPASSLWADTSYIPATPPTSSDGYVGVYKTTSSFRMTVDTTVSNNRTFIARETWGNPASAIKGDWIDTQFGADYIIKVYKGDPSTTAAEKILSAAGTTGKDDVWFFDYSSGVLNFNGADLNGQLSGITTSNIYIVGYRYLGTKGVQPPAGIGTFNNLYVSGISTFVGLVDINGGGQANTFKVEDLTDNRIVIAGADGELEDSANLTFDGTVLALTGNQTISGTIDVDGRSELDNVNIAETLNVVGVSTFTGAIDANGDLDVDGRSELDNVNIAETLNVVGVSTFNANVHLLDNDRLRIGGSAGTFDGLELYHDGSHSYINDSGTGELKINGSGIEILSAADTVRIGSVLAYETQIFHSNSEKFASKVWGINVTGTLDTDQLKVSGISTFTGAIDANGDLDVDGRAELDNVNIAETLNVVGVSTFAADIDANADMELAGNLAVTGISTFTGNIDANGDLDVDGRAELDNVNIAETLNVVGVSTFTGNIAANGNLDVDGRSELDNVNIAETLNVVGVSTFTGNIDANGNLDVDGQTDLDVLNVSDTATFSATVVAQKSVQVTQNLNVTGITTLGSIGISTGRITGPAITYIDPATVGDDTGIVVIKGDLQIDGTQTTVNSATMTVTDKNIEIAKGAANDAAADGAGITIDSGDGDKTLNWVDSTDAWTSSEHFDLAAGKSYDIAGTEIIHSLRATLGGTLSVTGVSTFTGNIDANGDLDVDGRSELDNVNIAETLNVVGVSTFTGNIDANGALDVDGRAELDNVNIAETLNVVGVSTFTAAIDANGDLDVDGRAELDNVNIAETLNVVGVSTFTNNIDANAGLDVDGTSDLDQVNIAQGLNVTAGIATFAADIDANADMELAGNLAVTGVSTFTGDIDANADIELAGNLAVTGVSTFTGNIDANGSLDVDGRSELDNVNIAETLNVVGVSTFTGNIDANGNLDVDGQTDLDILNVAETATFSSNIDANGDLDVDGTSDLDQVNIAQGLNVTAGIATFAGDIDANADMELAGNLAVTGVSTFTGNIDANGNLDVDGQTDLDVLNVAETATFSSNIDANGDLDVDGRSELDNVNVAETLNVVGVSTFTGNIDANGDLDVDGRSELDNVNIAETLNVVGVSTFTGNIDANGDLDVDGRSELDNVNIAETLNVVGVSTFTGNIDANGNLDVDGTSDLDQVNIAQGLNVTAGIATFAADIDANADMELAGNLAVVGVSTFSAGTVKVTKSVQISENLNVTGITTFNGAITLPPGTGGNFGNINIAVTGNNEIDTDSGNLIIDSAGGTINVDDGLTVAGVSTFTGNIDANAGLDVDGTSDLDQVNVAQGLNVTAGIATFAADIDANADIELAGNLAVTGVSTFTGNIDANGDLDVDGRAELDNVNIAETLNVVGVSTFNDDVNFIGAASTIQFDKSDNSLDFSDNARIRLGDNSDIQIYHNSSDSFGYISNSNSEPLRITGQLTQIRNSADNANIADFHQTTGVQLYYSGTKRFATSGTGVNITDDINVAGVSTFVGETNIGTGGTVFTALVGAAASVGIGSALPDYMLDVAGAINSETDIKVQGVSVSDTALNDAVAMAIALG